VTPPIVIAGGGLAAQRFAETLRRLGYDRSLHMVCAEPVAPYDRPPLSKELLAGERAPASLRLRDDGWYRDNGVDLHLGARATGLDAHRRRLELADGSHLRYERLLIATGAAPRVPPQLQGFDNVLTLRDLPDALALAEHLRPGRRLVVVGAGFIGLEVAATARALGVDVTVVEAAPTPLAGPLGPEVGAWFARIHSDRGVTVLAGARIAGVHGYASVRELRLDDGTRLPADVVLAAVGVAPDTSWFGGTLALPRVVAAGDVTGHQHWEAAVRSAANAARGVLGLPPVPVVPAGFWSDQHGVRFQLVGDTTGAERTTLDGDPGACDFAVTYWRGDRPAAILLAGRPSELPGARRMIAGADSNQERSAA
jgi:3-phenylpropionate/trans-cinnamate dioxygenase ferredoxin reductase component